MSHYAFRGVPIPLWDEEKGATTTGFTTKTNGRGPKALWIDGPHFMFSCLAEEVLIQKWLDGLKAPTRKTRQQSILRVNNSLILIQSTITIFTLWYKPHQLNWLKYQFNILINLGVYKLHQLGFFQTFKSHPNLSMNTYHHTLKLITPWLNPWLQECSPNYMGQRVLVVFLSGLLPKEEKRQRKTGMYINVHLSWIGTLVSFLISSCN
jgi:hypothetical protein